MEDYIFWQPYYMPIFSSQMRGRIVFSRIHDMMICRARQYSKIIQQRDEIYGWNLCSGVQCGKE